MGAKTLIAVDLFCGAGGLTNGLRRAGLEVPLGIDVDPACEFPYEANNPGSKFFKSDITAVTPEIVNEAWKGADIRILAGCAPCQPFSTYTQGRRGDETRQWSLLRAFGRLIIECKPDVVTMENVGRLARLGAFQEFTGILTDAGYEVSWGVLDCRLFGIPQLRKRLVLIASKFGKPALPKPTHPNANDWRTVRQAIGKLRSIRAGGVDPDDPLHIACRLSPINIARIKASRPGGTWRDWPKKLIAACHKRDSGQTYPSVYGRMQWDLPSPTITGQCHGFGNGRFGHPKQNRAISLREAAMLQTFPKQYKFCKPGERIHISRVGLMIGNAVPPRLAEVVGRAIRQHILDFSK